MQPLIHVVDDDASFRTAIERLLRTAGYDVALYETARHLLGNLPNVDRVGCILLDVRIPGLSGPELQHQLTALGSALPIIFLTGHGDIPTSVRAIKAGAEDFLTKPVAMDTLLKAIERAIERCRKDQEQQAQFEKLRARIATLTPREREVFDLVVRGKLNKQIAYELHTTERTIKAHRHSVMQKTQVQSLAELVSMAERLGLLTSHPDAARRAGIKLA